jgi:hypothetical protein
MAQNTTFFNDKLFEALILITSATTKLISEILNSFEDQSNEEISEAKNLAKMVVFMNYLYATLANKLQNAMPVAKKPKGTTAKGAKGKRTKKDTEIKDDDSSAWEKETNRERFLTCLLNFLDLNLSKLWKASLPEENFVNLFSKIVYLLLENPINTKSKAIKRSIFLIIACLIKRYNQSIGAVASLDHLLHNFEHIPPVLAELMETLVNEFDLSPVFAELIK